jgi:hypothetical protein
MRVRSGDGVSCHDASTTKFRLTQLTLMSLSTQQPDINTTPPTPDMYYASRPQKASRRENSDETALTARMSHESASSGMSYSQQSPAIATATAAASTTTTMPKYHPNPIFRQMQDKNKSVPMDWPTVPL